MTTTHINKVATSMTIVISMIFFEACNKTNIAKEVQAKYYRSKATYRKRSD